VVEEGVVVKGIASVANLLDEVVEADIDTHVQDCLMDEYLQRNTTRTFFV
jgi:hypothetical protein